MKTENYTTLEQAERLVRNGIDPNTSDLSYQNICYKGIGYTNKFEPTITPYTAAVESKEGLEREYMEFYQKTNNVEGLDSVCAWEVKPCWSIGALIDFIPYCCVKSDPICERYYVSCGSQETDSDALVGALVEMVCILKERKIL